MNLKKYFSMSTALIAGAAIVAALIDPHALAGLPS